MLDFILGLFLAGLLVRGWTRGFVRELLDLVGLIGGLWIAFTLNQPFGDWLTRSFGVTSEVARIGAGIGLFLLFGIALSIAAHYLSKMMNLPGLTMINRVGGAAVAVGWGVALVFVVVSLVRVFPIPESWERQIDESSVIEMVAGQDALPRQLLEGLAGDNLLSALDVIQDLFGVNRAVPGEGEILEIPPTPEDEVRQVRSEADDILDEINKIRTGKGLGALVMSAGFTDVAEQKAIASYTSGQVFRGSDCASTLSGAGVNVAGCGEVVALASTALGALDGILDTPHGEAQVTHAAYDRAGVAVVEGPTGRLLVVFFGS